MGAHCLASLATSELAGVWYNAVVTGWRAMPDGEGPWILCTRVGLADGC